MPPITNNNFGPGTLNNVLGDQVNHFATALVFHNSIPSLTQTTPPAVFVTPVSDRYHRVILNIKAVCALLHKLKDYSPQDDALRILCLEVESLARVVAYVAKALDIIETIPGNLRSLQHVKQVKSVVRNYDRHLCKLQDDILVLQSQIIRFLESSFWKCFFLSICAKHRWKEMNSEINKHLKDSRTVLEQFLHFLACRTWSKIIADEYGQELERFVLQVGLQPDPVVRHLQMHKILVRDHLGRLLPIPLEFCTSWTDFDIVLKHYCRNVEGSDLIQQDNWEIVRADDNTVIDRSHFMSTVEPEMEFDISIILQMLASSLFVCPGCGHDNPRRDLGDGWINCYKCDKHFRVVSTSPLIKAESTVRESQQNQSESSKQLRKSFGRRLLGFISKPQDRRKTTLREPEDNFISDRLYPRDALAPHDTHHPLNPNFVRVSVKAQRIVSRPVTNQEPETVGSQEEVGPIDVTRASESTPSPQTALHEVKEQKGSPYLRQFVQRLARGRTEGKKQANNSEHEKHVEGELTRMIGYLTATSSEDMSLILDVCDRASASYAGAKEAIKALRLEFKYAEPSAQLSAARLWAIMLQNSSDVFFQHSTSRRFLDTLEDLIISPRTNPVVRDRMLDVLAAAAYTSERGRFKDLWRKVKPADRPEEGEPFHVDDMLFNSAIQPQSSFDGNDSATTSTHLSYTYTPFLPPSPSTSPTYAP